MAAPVSSHVKPAGDWPAAELEHVSACPACGAEGRAPLHSGLRDRLLRTPGRWELWRCSDCGSAFLDPRPTDRSIGAAYGEDYVTHEPPGDHAAAVGAVARLRRRLLHGYLNARFGYSLPAGLAAGRVVIPMIPDARARTERFIRNMAFTGDQHRLLDVGCGNGDFLVQMRGFGWAGEGLDVDSRALAEARAAGLRVREGTIDALDPQQDRFDAITLGHVIEHVHDPRSTLEQIRTLLRPGGMVWLATPNITALGHAGFGPDWYGLDPPRHLVLFSPAGLRRLLESAGFARVEQRRPPPGARWMFPPSLAIRRGRNPLDGWPSLPLGLKLRRLAVEASARRRPELEEELTFAAWTADSRQ